MLDFHRVGVFLITIEDNKISCLPNGKNFTVVLTDQYN